MPTVLVGYIYSHYTKGGLLCQWRSPFFCCENTSEIFLIICLLFISSTQISMKHGALFVDKKYELQNFLCKDYHFRDASQNCLLIVKVPVNILINLVLD